MTGSEPSDLSDRPDAIRSTQAAQPSTALPANGNTRKVLDSAPFHPRGHMERACTTIPTARRSPMPPDGSLTRRRCPLERDRRRPGSLGPVDEDSGAPRRGSARSCAPGRPTATLGQPSRSRRIAANRCAALQRAGPAVAAAAGARLPDERATSTARATIARRRRSAKAARARPRGRRITARGHRWRRVAGPGRVAFVAVGRGSSSPTAG